MAKLADLIRRRITLGLLGSAPSLLFAATDYTMDGSIAPATQDCTIPGFGGTPKAAIVILHNAPLDGTPEANISISMGFFDGTNQRTQYFKEVEGASNNVNAVSAGHANDRVGAVFDNQILNNDIFQELEAVEFIPNGIRLRAHKSTGGFVATVILIGGSLLESAVVGNITAGASGTEASGNRMDAGFFLSHHAPGGFNDDPPSDTIGFFGLGMAAWNGSSFDQQAQCIRMDRGATKQVQGDIRTGAVSTLPVDRFYTVNSRTDTGFSWTATGAYSPDMSYLSLELADGTQAVLDTFTAPNATGDFAITHGVTDGVLRGSMMVKSLMPALATQYTAGEAGAMGVAVVDRNGNELSTHWRSQDNDAAPYACNTYFESDDLGQLLSHTGALTYASSAATVDDDGVTIPFTTVSASTHQWFAMHFVTVEA